MTGRVCVAIGAVVLGGMMGWPMTGRGAGPATAPAPATAQAATQADERPVMRVGTTEEFLKAIGPNRIIELAPGEYRLSDAKRGISPYFKWNETIENQYEVVIRNCAHLTIRCAGEKPAHLIMGQVYSNVLCFSNCAGLELVNLKMGHAPDIGECMGGVIKAEKCDGMTIRKCDLYGCGTQGLDLKEVDRLLFVDSVIHDCSYGIATLEECTGARFENSSFRRIREFHGFDFISCDAVALKDCVIEDVRLSERDATLFKTNLSDADTATTMTGGAIRNNQGRNAINVRGMLKLDGVKVENNSWDR